MRGGVSVLLAATCQRLASSPRAWGCFYLVGSVVEGIAVFPTCVGVFPLLGVSGRKASSLPHVRGGVSQRPFAPGR